MEVQDHTTPESRQALRNSLRQRRLTTSIHQTITMQTLNDLEEALRLLGRLRDSPDWWKEEVATFLDQRLHNKQRTPGTPLPGLLREG